MLSFDPSINLGTVIHLISLLIAMGGLFWHAASKFSKMEALFLRINDRLSTLESSMEKITSILVTLGKQEVRLDALDRRIDEIRSGLHITQK